jgi:hypothetical protein
MSHRRPTRSYTVPGIPEHAEDLGDAALSLGYAWGTAGYLIGLAVGMQLGPHVFDRVGARFVAPIRPSRGRRTMARVDSARQLSAPEDAAPVDMVHDRRKGDHRKRQ